MRHEYDTLIRHLADATKLDFYYVERMLRKMIEEVVNEKKPNPQPDDESPHIGMMG